MRALDYGKVKLEKISESSSVILKTICNTRLASDDFVTCKKGESAKYELSKEISQSHLRFLSILLAGLRGQL